MSNSMKDTSYLKLQAPFERLKISNKEKPTVALAKATLLQAIIDYCVDGSSKAHNKIQQDAENWLFNNFEEMCMNADLEPSYVKRIAREIRSKVIGKDKKTKVASLFKNGNVVQKKSFNVHTEIETKIKECEKTILQIGKLINEIKSIAVIQ